MTDATNRRHAERLDKKILSLSEMVHNWKIKKQTAIMPHVILSTALIWWTTINLLLGIISISILELFPITFFPCDTKERSYNLQTFASFVTHGWALARGFVDHRVSLLAAVRGRGVGDGGGRRHAHSVDRGGRSTVRSGAWYTCRREGRISWERKWASFPSQRRTKEISD